MATGLVKWWRARFLAGYKPFSVVGGNTEGSDSEELLAGIATPCTASPPPPPLATQPILAPSDSPQLAADGPAVPTPAPVNDEQPTSSTTKQLSFEEFECDVSVAEGDRRRQEFSFTLYDFDGHGKITKDDIAGLVTTIYDTLGASIQVPPCGSKTIKVKLTVSPDQRANQTRPACFAASRTTTSLAGAGSPCCHLKDAAPCNHHATARAAHGLRRVARRRRVPRNRCQMEPKEAETHSEDDDAVNARSSRAKQEELRRRVDPAPHLPSPYSNSSEGDVSDDSDTSPAFSPLTPLIASSQRKRSGALQRQQLLEIIQANMEKNNLSFHTSRKRHQTNEQPRVPAQGVQADPVSPYSGGQGCRPASESRQHPASGYHKPVRENSHHAASFPKAAAKTRGNLRKSRVQHGLQRNNGTASPRTPVQPHVLTRNVISPPARNVMSPPVRNVIGSPVRNDQHQQQQQQQHQHQHQQQQQQQHSVASSNASRNLSNLVANNQQTVNNQPPANNHNVQQRNESQFLQSQPCGKGSKKHQLKHATREQDQARAMAQVVRWLEREFSQNAAAASAGRRHVHEHIHHHYHHYHAEALV